MANDGASLVLPRGGRGFWQRRILDPLAAQFTQGITPERIALSLAVGSLCAFFPILGVATPLCVAAALALRLNQPLVQLVNGLTSPVYPFLWLAFVRVGERAAGAPPQALKVAAIAELVPTPLRFFHVLGAALAHAALGWAVLAPLWVPLAYFGLLPLLRAVAPLIVAGNRKSPCAADPGGHS